MFKDIIRTCFLQILELFGFNFLFRRLNKNNVLILFYHGVCEDNFTLLRGYDERHIPKSMFRKQLEFLTQKKYVFVTMSELMDILNKNSKIEKLVVLTFDDGFENVIKNAYPLLKDFNVKGILYVVSDLVGSKNLTWTDRIETLVRNSPEEFKFIFKGKTITYKTDTKKLCQQAMKDIKKKLRSILNVERNSHIEQFKNHDIGAIPQEFFIANWQQLVNLDNKILEIGGHTKTHPNCSNLTTDEEIEAELKHSKEIIEEKIGYRINHFCYPAGSFNQKIIDKLKEFGYTSAVTTLTGLNSRKENYYLLKRVGVIENFLLFKATTSGSYFFFKRLGNKILCRFT